MIFSFDEVIEQIYDSSTAFTAAGANATEMKVRMRWATSVRVARRVAAAPPSSKIS